MFSLYKCVCVQVRSASLQINIGNYWPVMHNVAFFVAQCERCTQKSSKMQRKTISFGTLLLCKQLIKGQVSLPVKLWKMLMANMFSRIVVYKDDMLKAIVPRSAKPFNFQEAYKLSDETVSI